MGWHQYSLGGVNKTIPHTSFFPSCLNFANLPTGSTGKKTHFAFFISNTIWFKKYLCTESKKHEAKKMSYVAKSTHFHFVAWNDYILKFQPRFGKILFLIFQRSINHCLIICNVQKEIEGKNSCTLLKGAPSQDAIILGSWSCYKRTK